MTDHKVDKKENYLFEISSELLKFGREDGVPVECRTVVTDLFEEAKVVRRSEGCMTGNIKRYNGTCALIKDWGAKTD